MVNKDANNGLIRSIDANALVSNLGTSCRTSESLTAVAEAWATLSGKWISHESPEEEKASIVGARSFGREEIDFG